jgi:vacuolar-type H+-ATPase subunit E/Vma4
LEAEENTRLEAKRAEKEAAEEAGISLSKYRKSQRKKAKAEGREKAKEATLEEKRKILEGKTADEISSIVNGSFEEILGDDFKGDLSVSLDIKDLQINCKSSLGGKRNRILIGKSGSTIKQVAKQISEKLGLDWIRVNIA